MNLTEIVVAGFWLASGVEVFGFTYEAFQQTYEQFAVPGTPGSGWTAPGLGGAATTEGLQNFNRNLAQTVGQGGADWLTNFLANMPILGAVAKFVQGNDPIATKEYARLNKLKQPPQTMVNQVRQANKQGGQRLVTAANNLLGWAKMNGWKESDVSAFLKLLGVKVF